MALTYYANRISPNISRTPKVGDIPGSLICERVPIARTGWQPYTPQELKIEAPVPIVQVYRSPEEVFHPAALASFESVPVTDTHPPEFVSPVNWCAYSRGHVTNVRVGNAYADGEYVLADLMIKDASLINKVEPPDGQRETSAGYTYDLVCYTCARPPAECICPEDTRDYRYSQINIRGNHVAVVPNGRAGHEVRINDAAPALEETNQPIVETTPEKPETLAPAVETIPPTNEITQTVAATDAAVPAVQINSEREERPKLMETPATETGTSPIKNWFTRTFGLGLAELSKTAKPEEVTEAARSLYAFDSESEAVERNKEYAAKAHERARLSAVDEEPKEPEKKEAPKEEPKKEEVKEKEEGKDTMDRNAKDAQAATDARMDRLCDAIESLVKAQGSNKGSEKAKDAEAEGEIKEDEIKDAEVSEEEKEKESRDADVLQPVEELSGEEIPENPIPGADSAAAMKRYLQSVKPIIAASGDRKAIDAFNKEWRRVAGTDTTPGRKGTYADLNNPKKGEDVRNQEQRVGKDAVRKSPEEIGADFEKQTRKYHRKNAGEVNKEAA